MMKQCTFPCRTKLEESELHITLFSHHLMPLDEALCGIVVAQELSLGVMLFLLESTLNAFSAFLLTDSSGSLTTSLWCAVGFGPDLPGETCMIHIKLH